MSDPVRPSALQMKQFCEALERLEKEQVQLFQALQHLSHHLDQLTVAAAPPPVSLPLSAVPDAGPPTRLHLPTPATFSGDHKACWGFINQCGIQFELSPGDFPTQRSKDAYVISLLSDHLIQDYSAFIDAFRKTFDGPGRVTSAASSLLQLRQGTSTVGQ